MLGIIVINIDPVIHLGPLAIHWYGVMYAIAFFVAYRFAVVPLAQRAGVASDTVSKITVWTIVIGLIGGRLYYVLQQPDLFSHYLPNPIHIIAFWEGGMAFFGAIIAGFITLTICAWQYGLNPWLALDGGAAFAVVGQPIGRIGNLINGDILGSPSTLPWATAYANPGAILQKGFQLCTPTSCIAYQPAAAYEALATMAIGVVLLLLYRRRVPLGVIAITYVAAYAISQLIVFEFRASEPAVLLGLRQAQWTSIGVLVIGVPGLYLAWRWTSCRILRSQDLPETAHKASLEQPRPTA
ncbi:MAG: prolipoprotein diacylglyceryl transferase [Candidatus Dormibacteria bacterium]